MKERIIKKKKWLTYFSKVTGMPEDIVVYANLTF